MFSLWIILFYCILVNVSNKNCTFPFINSNPQFFIILFIFHYTYLFNQKKFQSIKCVIIFISHPWDTCFDSSINNSIDSSVFPNKSATQIIQKLYLKEKKKGSDRCDANIKKRQEEGWRIWIKYVWFVNTYCAHCVYNNRPCKYLLFSLLFLFYIYKGIHNYWAHVTTKSNYYSCDVYRRLSGLLFGNIQVKLGS